MHSSRTHIQGVDGNVPDDVGSKGGRAAAPHNHVIVDSYMLRPQGLAVLRALVGVIFEADGIGGGAIFERGVTQALVVVGLVPLPVGGHNGAAIRLQ